MAQGLRVSCVDSMVLEHLETKKPYKIILAGDPKQRGEVQQLPCRSGTKICERNPQDLLHRTHRISALRGSLREIHRISTKKNQKKSRDLCTRSAQGLF